MATLKTCFKCGAAKPRTEFYPHPHMGDGLLGKCKVCTRRDARNTRASRPEYYRAYDRDRATLPHRVVQRKQIGQQWRAQHPDRRAAHTLLRRAVRAGTVIPQPCMVCGGKAEAHHPDYSRQLDVVWLCPPHHKQAHALLRAAA